MLKAYTIFDDFSQKAIDFLTAKGIDVTVHPKGVERPNEKQIKAIVDNYDVIIVGTSQKMPEAVFENINEKRIIATASIGMDHIKIPSEKSDLIKIVNAPKANRISVAEHTFSLILALKKHLLEGRRTALNGQNKKQMRNNPTDLYGTVIGVVGAGGTAGAVLKMSSAFGMKRLCYTAHPENHSDLSVDGVEFVDLNKLLSESDIVSINLPLVSETKKLITENHIALLKDDAIFVSLSRSEIVDNEALFKRAKASKDFCIALDVDSEKVYGLWDDSMDNVIVTPHIGGGTVQSRKRMFIEVSENIISYI